MTDRGKDRAVRTAWRAGNPSDAVPSAAAGGTLVRTRSPASRLRSLASGSGLAALCAAAFVAAAPAAAAAAAQASAAREPAGYWLGDADAPMPATLHGGRVIHAKQLAALLARGGVVVIDVSAAAPRPAGLAPGAPWLPLPHSAVPGALWLPGAGAGVLTPQQDEFFRGRLAQAAGNNTEVPMVLYCHHRCWLSWNAAKRAIGYGYRRVYWFPDGIEGWTAAGLPTVTAEPQQPAAPEPERRPPAPVAADALDAPDAKPALVVLDIELTGDLGGPELTAEHAARLSMETTRLRGDLAKTALYRIVDTGPAQATLDRLRAGQAYLHDCNGCDLDVGRQLNADLVMVPWVDRVSGLILTLTYEIHDVHTGSITARRSFDFRGDNDAAWNHAIDFAVRDLQAAPARSPISPPE